MLKGLLFLALFAILWHLGIIQLVLVFCGGIIVWLGALLVNLGTL